MNNRYKFVTPSAADGFPVLDDWGHKAVARAGDVVYLQHKNTLRGVTLATTRNADPGNGKISVTSPMGLALVGRHQGDKVRLNTLDGTLEYTVVKVV